VQQMPGRDVYLDGLLVDSDYKSPYAFLAKDLIYELEDRFDVHLEWLPYTLDIPSYLGSARLDERGEVIESNRNAHQWRRVRYSYMDLPATSPQTRTRLCSLRTRGPGLMVAPHAHQPPWPHPPWPHPPWPPP
jgi:hypothetical protein